MSIPRIIHRIVPEKQTELMDFCWQSVIDTHGSDWELITHVAPENTSEGWELTRSHWSKCPAPAFMCDLMRLEVLWNYGGIYLDSDMYIFKDMSPLLGDQPFVGLESQGRWLCNAVIGSPAKHPALLDLIEGTKKVLDSGVVAHPPIVTTDVWGPRSDITFLGQDEFFMHDPDMRGQIPSLLESMKDIPGVYGQHLWAASWFNNGRYPQYMNVHHKRMIRSAFHNPFEEAKLSNKPEGKYSIPNYGILDF